MSARVVPGAFGLLTTVVLTHLLTPKLYGIYGVALVIMSFGSDAAFDWLGISLVRFYQGDSDKASLNGTFSWLFIMMLLITAAVTIVAWLAGAFVGTGAEAILIGILLMWAYSWFEFASRFEVANFRPSRYLMMNAMRGLFAFVGSAGAAWSTHNPFWTAAGFGLGAIAGALVSGISFDWRYANFDSRLFRAILVFGLPVAASSTIASFAFNGTRWFVQRLDSMEALGFYTAAFLLVQNTLSLMGEGVASAGYSLAVRALENGNQRGARLQLLQNCTFLVAILAPAALGIMFTAKGLAAFLVGPQYERAVSDIVPWMALASALFVFRAHYLDHAFQLGKRPELQIWVAVLMAIVSAVLSVLLIPKYGPAGAAMALVGAAGTSCVHAWLLSRRAYRLQIPVGQTLRIFVACAAMAVAIICTPGGTPLFFVMQIVVGVVVYTATAVSFDVLHTRAWFLQLVRWS